MFPKHKNIIKKRIFVIFTPASQKKTKKKTEFNVAIFVELL